MYVIAYLDCLLYPSLPPINPLYRLKASGNFQTQQWENTLHFLAPK